MEEVLYELQQLLEEISNEKLIGDTANRFYSKYSWSYGKIKYMYMRSYTGVMKWKKTVKKFEKKLRDRVMKKINKM